jgi:membrane protein required for beta-lactamase induction
MFGFRINQPRTLLIKIVVIFVPVFAMAHLTQNMVYVLPTLAIGVLFGGSINGDTKTDYDDTDADPGDS